MEPTDLEPKDVEVGKPLLESSFFSSRSSESALASGQTCHACILRDTHNRVPLDRTRGLWLSYLNLLFFLTSIVLLARSRAANPAVTDAREALKATSAYSPIFDEVDLTPVWTTVDGRLHTPANSSVFRGEPSVETDEAWDDLAAEAYEVILADADTLKRAGYNPAHFFKAPKSWGYGDDKFPVQIDVFHQIHCLNAVRKQMYFQHYYADEFPNGPDEMHWMHQRHCLHMVLQSLTCNANVDIVPHRWVENDEVPFAQFSIGRKCRNFDNLRQWNQENAIKDVRKVWPHSKDAMPADAFVWPVFGE
ncbi:hypothetical protein GGR51DRAFT_468572 [Nemania sp. FL0031]|nr:hypothetical protein GGR51DRAFT_468572 [Nemania sp. FL0031]